MTLAQFHGRLTRLFEANATFASFQAFAEDAFVSSRNHCPLDSGGAISLADILGDISVELVSLEVLEHEGVHTIEDVTHAHLFGVAHLGRVAREYVAHAIRKAVDDVPLSLLLPDFDMYSMLADQGIIWRSQLVRSIGELQLSSPQRFAAMWVVRKNSEVEQDGTATLVDRRNATYQMLKREAEDALAMDQPFRQHHLVDVWTSRTSNKEATVVVTDGFNYDLGAMASN